MAIPHLFMESPRPPQPKPVPETSRVKALRLAKNLGIGIGIFFLILVILSFLVPTFVKPAVLEQFLVAAVDQNTNYSLSVERPNFSILPVPSFRFSNVKLWNKTSSSKAPPLLTADRIDCRLKLISLLFRKIEFSKIKFDSMNLSLQDVSGMPIRITNMDLQLEDVGSGRWMRASGAGSFLSTARNLRLSGKMKSDFQNFNLHHALFALTAELKNIDLVEAMKTINNPLSNQIKRGSASVSLEVSKKDESPAVNLETELHLDQVTFASAGEDLSAHESAAYDLKLDAQYDVDTKVLMMKSIDLGFPFAKIHGKGGIDFAAKRFEDVQLASDSIMLDQLHQYLPLTQILPLHLGFSGEGQADLKLSGVWNELSVLAKIDLTKSLLTYSKYFSKPKGVPLTITTEDLMIKRQQELDGGINVEFKEVKLKGALVKFDVVSKVGEITFVTNLVPLEGWEEYFPTFSGYHFSGTSKFFGNGKGDFQNPGRILMMSHAAFNDVGVKSSDNQPLIEKLNGNIDMGPMDFETKDLGFDFGKSHFDVDVKAFFTKPPQFGIDIKSPETDVRNFVLQMRRVVQVLGLNVNGMDWNQIEKQVNDVVPSDTTLTNLVAKIDYQNNKLILQHIDFDVFGGHVNFIGVAEHLEKSPETSFQFHTELQNLSLARMSRRDLKAPVEGNLFLVVDADGEGFSQEALQSKLKGEGTVMLTNGEFHTFDVLGSMGAVAELAGLGKYISGTTRFSDVNGKLRIANGKVQMDHLLMVSNDFNVDASGDVAFDGNLNFRLDTVLSNELSRKIDSKVGPQDRLGPIPLLLTGKISSPTLRPDPTLIKDFIGSLLSNKLGDVIAGKGWLKTFTQPAKTANTAQASSPEPSKKPTDDLAQTGLMLLDSLFQKKE